MTENEWPNATDPELGFLVDAVGHRVLAGAPALLRSTFTRLVFLGPEGEEPLLLRDVRQAVAGEQADDGGQAGDVLR